MQIVGFLMLKLIKIFHYNTGEMICSCEGSDQSASDISDRLDKKLLWSSEECHGGPTVSQWTIHVISSLAQIGRFVF